MIKKNNGHIPKPKLTFGQKASDALSKWAGSWTFIIALIVFLIIWMLINIHMIENNWDPYPFILLNFVLSTMAALQAPVILMSQNRAAERDRINAKYDYQVNRKAEREIQNMQRDLNEIKRLIKKKFLP